MAKLNLACALILLLILGGCLSDERAADAGTGSETTNHIAGVILDNEGAPSARTRVLLVRSDFNPLTDAITAAMAETTDAKGNFRFGNPGTGHYHLEAAGLASHLHGLKEEFHYTTGAQKVSDLNLDRPGYVRVDLPDSLRVIGAYIFVPGTTYHAVIGEHRRSVLGPLPAMRIPRLAYARAADSAWVILARDFAVTPEDTVDFNLDSTDTSKVPGDSTVVAPKDSVRAWRLWLNTTSNGAAVSQNVYGFPMLVRLDSSNFDFSLARDGGYGIEFSKTDSTPLPFEIERWDSTARKAEIWVRMDTVYGGRDTQSLWMRYNPAATYGIGIGSGSYPPDVFRSQSGFVGVWHLGTASGDRPDATGFGRWGRPVGYDGDEQVEGVIGAADSLDGRNDYLDVGILNVERQITMSAWVRSHRSAYWAAIIQKPALIHDEAMLYSYVLTAYKGNPLNLSMGVSDGGHGPYLDAAANLTGWALVHATYDGMTFSIYCNGTLVESFTERFSMGLEQNNRSTLFGAWPHTLADKFTGVLDEVRIERVVRGPWWVRLSYENQKAGQTLVKVAR